MVTAYAVEGWMNYKVRLENGQTRSVYYAQHNSPYIRINGERIYVWFNHLDADSGKEVKCVRVAE